MAKETIAKKTDEKIAASLNFDQLNDVNWKLNIGISTLDMLSGANDEMNMESLTTLAAEARDRLEEARDILNSDRNARHCRR